jgi:NAD(P)H-hydrate epimerase
MTDDYRIGLIQMMETAGRNLAHLARRRFLGGDATNKRIVVLAGRGGNGGGSMVCARQLDNWEASVVVALTGTPEPGSASAQQLATLEQVGIHIVDQCSNLESANLIVDGIIGYGLSGNPTGVAAEMIRWANDDKAPVLSLDVPTGVEATTGQAAEPAIHADATMTLALPKTGLRSGDAENHVGELYLADIGVPTALYQEMGLGGVAGLFALEDIIRLH